MAEQQPDSTAGDARVWAEHHTKVWVWFERELLARVDAAVEREQRRTGITRGPKRYTRSRLVGQAVERYLDGQGDL